jgi:hypothetical protein
MGRVNGMRYGLYVSPCGEYADARLHGELAQEAEAAGWDGYFLWDHISMGSDDPVIDPWIALTCVALGTERLRLGPLVTPVARRRPAKLARVTVSLDRLSGGRLILGVGLGDIPHELERLGESGDLRERAEQLDEGLEVLTAFWSGQAVTHAGKYYTVEDVALRPTPVQQPRIPIWVAGFWPRKGPFRRAARWDGMYPGKLGLNGGSPSPDDLRAMTRFVQSIRPAGEAFDVVVAGETGGLGPGEDVEIVRGYEGVATWWLEHVHQWRGSLEEMRRRIQRGPPIGR